MEKKNKNQRGDDQYVAGNIPVRKKFVKENLGWGAMAAMLTIFISLGWIPPTTSAEMDKHEEWHRADFARMEKQILAHGELDRHPGASSKAELRGFIFDITEQINSVAEKSATRDKAQQAEITKIQVEVATIKADSKHIKEMLTEIRAFLRNR